MYIQAHPYLLFCRIQTDASLLGPAQSLFNGLKQLNTNISRSDSYTFIQEDDKRPGVFLALYGNHLVEISDGKLAFLTQKNTHFFLAPFSFLQQSNSSKIIVADNELKCLLYVERGKWDVSVHSGLCVADDSPDPVDGSFSECRYSGPYDIQTHPENSNVAFLTDFNTIKRLDLVREVVTTVFDRNSQHSVFGRFNVDTYAAFERIAFSLSKPHKAFVTTDTSGISVFEPSWKEERVLDTRISQHSSQVQIKLGRWSKFASDTVTAFDSITFISEDILLVTI